MTNRPRRQLALLAASAAVGAVLLAFGIQQWWVWLVWAAVVLSQIAVGLGVPQRLAPPPPPPARHQRADYADRLEAFELDRQHQAQVDAWRAQQNEQ